MKSILPVDYMFSSQNVLTPDKMHVNFWDKITYGNQTLLVIIFITMILIFGLAFLHHKCASFEVKTYLAIMCAFFMTWTIGMGSLHDVDAPVQRPYEINCEFRLSPNSNLIVKQAKTKYPLYENEKTKYPYRLYIKDDSKSNKLTYLGQTNKQRINLDDSTKTSDLFTAYYYYVQKHHLTSHFSHKLYFEKDSNITDANGVPQYVLKGDGITLKIKPNKASTYQIYTDKD